MNSNPLNTNTYISIEKLTKSFDKTVAVDRVDLEIRKGEIFGLLGSSGCGKSTLLYLLAGLELPNAGKVFIDGVDITDLPAYKRPVNMMFQTYALFPHMTVEQNIAFGLKQDKLPKNEIKNRVEKFLQLVHMEAYAKRKPDQLSGGQQQRVALARSLVKQPKLLLLDEPLAALDKKLREHMQMEIISILKNVGATCLMVTHDQDEAMVMAQRLGVMERGNILQIGTPKEVYETPTSRFVAEFIGSINLFAGAIVQTSPDYIEIKSLDLENRISVKTTRPLQQNQSVLIGIRPEKITLNKKKFDIVTNVARGKVKEIAYQGSHSIYHVELAGGKIVIANVYNDHQTDSLQLFDEVYLSWSAESAVVINP